MHRDAEEFFTIPRASAEKLNPEPNDLNIHWYIRLAVPTPTPPPVCIPSQHGMVVVWCIATPLAFVRRVQHGVVVVGHHLLRIPMHCRSAVCNIGALIYRNGTKTSRHCKRCECSIVDADVGYMLMCVKVWPLHDIFVLIWLSEPPPARRLSQPQPQEAL